MKKLSLILAVVFSSVLVLLPSAAYADVIDDPWWDETEETEPEKPDDEETEAPADEDDEDGEEDKDEKKADKKEKKEKKEDVSAEARNISLPVVIGSASVLVIATALLVHTIVSSKKKGL